MDVKFHWSRRATRSIKRSKKHDLTSRQRFVHTVLAQNPEYGVPVAGHGQLRKMRYQVPGLGSRGGYRLIYRKTQIDEAIHVVFLEIYYKPDKADLTSAEYKELTSEADQILKKPLSVTWVDPPAPPRHQVRL